MEALGRLSKFDAFQKSKDHAQVRTVFGASISIVAAVIMFLLFISEVAYWRTTRYEDRLIVDSSQGDRDFDIYMDVTFHSLTCKDVVVRADDSKGVPYEPHRFRLQKAHPSLFDDPRILQTLKTNPRHPLHETTSKEPGCRVQGTITVKRVAGEVYVTNPRLSSHGFHAHYPNANFDELMNSFIGNHTINHISFGPPFPGQLSPLDNFVSPPQPTASRYLYHIKIVPTLYESLYKTTIIDSQQYSATDFVQPVAYANGHQRPVPPGVWFKYDFSPIMIHRIQSRRTFLQFLTSVCGILGGVFAISRLIDQIYFRAFQDNKNK